MILLAAVACVTVVASCSDTGSSLPGSSSATAGPRVGPEHAGLPHRPHLWVLSIGVSRYRDAQLQLDYAAADAQAFAEILRRQEGGPVYETVHTSVLVDANVTRETILQALETFLGEASPVDVAVIFLAGHGLRSEKPIAYYFLTEAASPTAPHIAGLDMAELSRQLQRLHRNIPRLVVVLDTCHAGAVAPHSERVQLGADLAPALAPTEGLYILTAARAGERSFELTQEQHGAFSYALLDGLGGAAADANGLISVFGLANHASHLVQQLTGDQQRPYIAMIGEDLALAADPRRLAQVTPPPLHLTRAEPAPERQALAIRNFDHLGPDTTYDWMRRALSQDVVTAFSELHQLDVYDENMLQFVTRDAPDVLDAVQRAGINMLVEGAYWVQDNQLSVSAQVKSVRPLQLIASARTQGPVEQFSVLTGQLVSTLLQQLSVEVPASLAERLQHPEMTSLAARRLLAESDVGGSAPPGASRSAIPPGAFLWPRWLPLPFDSIASAVGISRASLAAPALDIEADLRITLEAYRTALERKDIEALRSYYEDFTDGQGAALARYFASTENLRIEFTDVRVAVIGDNAAVSFTRDDRFTDRGTGQPQHASVRVTKRFTRRTGQWVIQREP